MKLSKNAAKALQQPDTRTKTFEMTPERKEKFSRVAHKVVDLLRAETEGPIEAYMVLHFCISALEDSVGIRGSVIVENQDAQQ